MNHPPKHIAKAHDYFFRMMMSDIRVAREFFSAHLPKDILSVTELEQMELQSGTYIDDLRQETIADMLFKTKIAGRAGYLYLLADHQSVPDELMPFRILKYVCNIIDQHLKSTETKRIPLVVPFVVYHGKQAWNYSTDIADLVDAPKEIVNQYFLKPFHLVDLTRIEDKILKQNLWSGVMELTLKYIFARDMLPYLKEIIELVKQLEKANGKNYAEIVLTYILD
jgi:predicted transposase/invertase (TIGR01784 family)